MQQQTALQRACKMVLGQILYALSIVLTMKANIGYCPWDVFHAGLAHTLRISVGSAITLLSFVLLLVSFPMKWKIGLGTIVNIFLCGALVDLFSRFIPGMQHRLSGLLMFFAGIILLAFASYCYIEPGYGTSLRDSFFVFLTKRLGGSVALARILMEIGLCLAGFLMGGQIGIGSALSCVLCGPCMQLVNRLLHFRITEVQHEDISATVKKAATAIRKKNH